MNLRKKINYFIKGMESILEIYPKKIELKDLFTHYSAKTPQEQDAQALTSDWNFVGKDLTDALQKTKIKTGDLS